MSRLRNIRDFTVVRTVGELFRLAEDREAFFQVIAYVRFADMALKEEESLKHQLIITD